MADASRSLLLLVSLAVGAVIAHVAMPHLFRAIPLASIRVEVVIDALRRRDVTPQIAVFGSSITATGVDPGALGDALPGRPTVFNLASPAQTLAEAVLIYQDLPASTRVVVQELAPWELTTASPFAPNKLNAYFSFGYRPSERTIGVLGEVFGPAMTSSLRSSETMENFRSRWVLSRLLDLSFWLNLRMQLRMEELASDISRFTPEQGRVDEKVMAVLLQRWGAKFSEPNPEIFAMKRRLVKLAVGELVSTGRRVVVYVPPIHPGIRAQMSGRFSEALEALLETAREAGAEIVSLAGDEPESEFHDALHLSGDAAARATRALARRLAEAPAGSA